MDEAKRQMFWNDNRIKVVPLKLAHNQSYLDTGTQIEEKKTSIHIVFKCLQNSWSGNPNCFGASTSPWFTFEFTNQTRHYPYFNIGTSTMMCPTDQSSFVLSYDDIYDMKLVVDPSTHQWECSGTWNKVGTYAGNLAGNQYPLLFGLRQRASNFRFAMVVYGIEIEKEDSLVQQFIPTVDSEGNACFFESVSKTMFYSAGSDSFESVQEN